MVPGSARNWIVVNAVQQFSLNKKEKIKNMTTLHLKKSIGRSPLRRGLLLIPLVLVCFGLLPAARAVVPAPDGGYPGYNTAEGQNALLNLTIGGGFWDTALGAQALHNATTGSFNTAVGLNALYFNNGNNNVAVGSQTLQQNLTGGSNVGVGLQALYSNSSGNMNTAVGHQALMSNGESGNTAIGYQALIGNTSGHFKTGVGFQAASSGDTNTWNTAVGYQADLSSTGPSNDAFGFQALLHTAGGGFNAGFGVLALADNVSGSLNSALGVGAGEHITGSGNVDIGYLVTGLAGESNTTRIKNIGSTFQNTGIYVTLDVVGGTKLGYVNLSSRRYKDEIKPMDKASEAILALKPVTFRFKKEFDPTHGPGYGLIAEEVEKVNPDLVSHNDKGEVMTVHYDAVNAMLLNEFLKEHRKVEELEATVAQQQKGMEVLTAQLKEQASQIQKVSAQLELNKTAPRTVGNK